MLLYFFLFFYSPTGKLSNKTLSTLSTPSNSLSQTLTSLSHCPRPDSILNVTSPLKLNVTNPPADPFHQTSKPTQAQSRRSTPQTHAFDLPLIHTSDPSRPSLILSTLSNSLSQTLTSKLSPLYPAAAAADPHLQPDSPSGELSLSFSYTCLGFLIWVIGMINL